MEAAILLRSRLSSSALVGLCIGVTAVLGSGCSHKDNTPKTLTQERSALTGVTAPPGALDQYMAQHPKMRVNLPPKN